MMKIKTIVTALALTMASSQAIASTTLFKNVNVFDGTNNKLHKNCNVLVEKNLIKDVCTKTTKADTTIDGKGKTLMPGIIEAHGHLAFPFGPDKLLSEDLMYIGLKASEGARFFIDNGWTTVRDTGGPSYGIKKAIDEGVVVGPRVYTSGMVISQTSGHGDFRRFSDPHPSDLSELPGFNRYFSHVVDGVPKITQAAREELRKGAVHLKLMAGGGLSSQYDPIHTTQYFDEEIEAAVKAAADWGTYVMVHAYTDASVARAINAGVKVVEHGQMISEETAKLMAEKGVWLSIQANFGDQSPETDKLVRTFGEVTYNKWLKVKEGTAKAIKYAKKYGVNVAFGTDSWGDALPRLTGEFISRAYFYSNFEILNQATAKNGELLKLTGPLNPYPEGDLGVIKQGAYADIILVDGNPLDDIKVMTKADNIQVVMKDGKVFKNIL